MLKIQPVSKLIDKSFTNESFVEGLSENWKAFVVEYLPIPTYIV